MSQSDSETAPAWAAVRDRVKRFVEDTVYPVETQLDDVSVDDYLAVMRPLMAEAKAAGLWALGHPKEIGGQGMPFMDYVYINEVVGRSEHAMVALGTHSLQDSIMLHLYADADWRERYLAPLVAGEVFPSIGMTEPAVASSDPTQLETHAVLDGDEWVINGRKWFTTWANRAAYTTVFARTEPADAPRHEAFSMIVVPTDNPGYRIVRETPVFGMNGGHCEVAYTDVRVPKSNLLGPRGGGFKVAQKRLGPGRIFHCMRWLGQAQRAFDLMCRRANDRVAFGSPLADKQLVQKMVFDSAAEIQACRLLTLDAGADDRCRRRSAGRDRPDQGGRRRDGAQCHRPRNPGSRRHGGHRRYAARAHVPPRPLRPDLRRTRRSPHPIHRAADLAHLSPRRRLGFRRTRGGRGHYPQ